MMMMRRSPHENASPHRERPVRPPDRSSRDQGRGAGAQPQQPPAARGAPQQVGRGQAAPRPASSPPLPAAPRHLPPAGKLSAPSEPWSGRLRLHRAPETRPRTIIAPSPLGRRTPGQDTQTARRQRGQPPAPRPSATGGSPPSAAAARPPFWAARPPSPDCSPGGAAALLLPLRRGTGGV